MKQINLDNFVSATNSTIASTELMNKINGGCTEIVIGRCPEKPSIYYLVSVTGRCGSFSSHYSKALSAAKKEAKPIGQFYHWRG